MFHNELFNKNGADNSFFNSLCWLSIITWIAGILVQKKNFLTCSCFDRWTGKRRNNTIVWGTSEQHWSKWWKESELCELSWVPCWETLCTHHVWVSGHVWCRKLGFQSLFKNYFGVLQGTFSGESMRDVDPVICGMCAECCLTATTSAFSLGSLPPPCWFLTVAEVGSSLWRSFRISNIELPILNFVFREWQWHLKSFVCKQRTTDWKWVSNVRILFIVFNFVLHTLLHLLYYTFILYYICQGRQMGNAGMVSSSHWDTGTLLLFLLPLLTAWPLLLFTGPNLELYFSNSPWKPKFCEVQSRDQSLFHVCLFKW